MIWDKIGCSSSNDSGRQKPRKKGFPKHIFILFLSLSSCSLLINMCVFFSADFFRCFWNLESILTFFPCVNERWKDIEKIETITFLVTIHFCFLYLGNFSFLQFLFCTSEHHHHHHHQWDIQIKCSRQRKMVRISGFFFRRCSGCNSIWFGFVNRTKKKSRSNDSVFHFFPFVLSYCFN